MTLNTLKKITLLLIVTTIFVVPFIPSETSAKMYSTRSERLFRESAKQYWEAHDWDSSVYCSPYETEIIYEPFDSGRSLIARVEEIGDGNRLFKGSPYYCKTWFNTRTKQTRRQACVTFVHEFGHLMGRVHNTNIESPMYNGYDYLPAGDRRWQLYVRWRKNILGNTLCRAGEIRG